MIYMSKDRILNRIGELQDHNTVPQVCQHWYREGLLVFFRTFLDRQQNKSDFQGFFFTLLKFRSNQNIAFIFRTCVFVKGHITYVHFKLHAINNELKCYTNKQLSHNCKSDMALSSVEERVAYFESSSDAVNVSIQLNCNVRKHTRILTEKPSLTL